MDKDMALAASGTGLSSPTAPEVAALRASIPSAGDFVIFRGWGLNLRQVAKVTPKLIKLERGGYPSQISHEAVVAFMADREAAKRLLDSIAGVDGAFRSRETKARRIFNDAIASAEEARRKSIERLVASAMSAGTAETLAAQGHRPASATGNAGDAETLSHSQVS